MFGFNQNRHMIVDYATLIAILGATFLLIRISGMSRESIIVATLPVSIGYIIWGVVHHKKHGHLDRKIMLEYFGLAALVNAIIVILIV